jgi:hypothetical protein
VVLPLDGDPHNPILTSSGDAAAGAYALSDWLASGFTDRL